VAEKSPMDRQWFHWAACPTFRSEVAQAVGAEPEVAAEVESAEWVAALGESQH